MKCRTDPSRFNETILCRAPYWWRQEEICRAVVEHKTVCVPAGNGVGKSYIGAGVALWFALMHPGCRVILAAPTAGQLEAVLWAEMQRAHAHAAKHGRQLGGRFSGLTLDYGDGWLIEGYGMGSVESKSGRHAADMLAIIDEASGAPEAVLDAIASTNPSRTLYLGNPLRNSGKFWKLVEGGRGGAHVIRIPSLESPDIGLPRSPRGMADAGFLADARAEYGESSQWWLSHVLAQFPGEDSETLLPWAWLQLAARTIHKPAGRTAMGIDLGGGNGGDPSMIVVRDDGGVRAAKSSATWTFEETAAEAAALASGHGVHGSRVVYDANGIGWDFDNRLRAAGIVGAIGFMGQHPSPSPGYTNMRTAAAWALRRRLDPTRSTFRPRTVGRSGGRRDLAALLAEAQAQAGGLIVAPSAPFAIPAELIDKYGDELRGVRNLLDPKSGANALEPKEAFTARLKHSPNFLDALAMSCVVDS